jgi:hypothetical protein
MRVTVKEKGKLGIHQKMCFMFAHYFLQKARLC